ncbi:MAG: hypothetical protein D6768_17220 [Chloroflexi bacterium]|nr:MAG: hypothetical protein D6768_17220 [Chloroflexota bacterium]
MTNTEQQISVVLADDHTVVRRGICDMLEDEGDIRVVAEAATAAFAMAFSSVSVVANSLRLRRAKIS